MKGMERERRRKGQEGKARGGEKRIVGGERRDAGNRKGWGNKERKGVGRERVERRKEGNINIALVGYQ